MAHAFLNSGNSVEVTQRCTKRAYDSMKDTRRAMGKMSRSQNGMVSIGSGRLNAYRCPICRAYHLGHKP